jgi:hypothetical protein
MTPPDKIETELKKEKIKFLSNQFIYVEDRIKSYDRKIEEMHEDLDKYNRFENWKIKLKMGIIEKEKQILQNEFNAIINTIR